jgi:hypothetical protein
VPRLHVEDQASEGAAPVGALPQPDIHRRVKELVDIPPMGDRTRAAGRVLWRGGM